jgi:hypothetical protein
MTSTTEPREMTMTDVTACLADELERAKEQASAAGEDPARVLAALDRLAGLLVAIDNARLSASATIQDLTDRALLGQVDLRDLYGRPFSDTWVRGRYAALREAHPELPAPPRGPRPRRLPSPRS